MSRQNGFGLLEVLIATAVIALTIGGAIGLMRASLRRTTIAADRTLAMQLAQEGIESVKAVRDSYYVDSKSNSFSEVLPVGGPLQVESQGPNGRPQLPPRIVEGSQTVSAQNQSRPTNFIREIYITDPPEYLDVNPLPNIDATNVGQVVKKIRVVVKWGAGGQDGQVESITYLTDWRTGV